MKEILEIKRNAKENNLKNKDIFGDLTPIIKNKIKAKVLLKNKFFDCRNKSNKSIEEKEYSALLTFNDSKRKEQYIENFHKNTFVNTISTTKDNSQTLENSYKIKKMKKINPEIFVNNKNQKNKNNKINEKEKPTTNKPKKKFDYNLMLNRFEEERKKASKNLEAKKQKIEEEENKINTNKPLLTNKKIINYGKYSKDFLIRQKQINDNVIKKTEKLIEEKNKKEEEEYKIMKSKNITKKNKKKNLRNKSDDTWVNRLYNQDTEKRKIKKLNLEKSLIPTFKPLILENRNKKNRFEKYKTLINELIMENREKNDPELLNNYLTNNKNKKEESYKYIYRNKISGITIKKFRSKKFNNNLIFIYVDFKQNYLEYIFFNFVFKSKIS